MNQFLHPIQTNNLFTSRNDTDDLRLGDIITPLPDSFTEISGAIVLLGVPQDEGVRRNGGRIGAAAAPDAIRKALYKFTPVFHREDGLTDISHLQIIDAGNIITAGIELEEIHKRQREVVCTFLRAGALPVVLGGGHDIAYPDGSALGDKGEPFSVINVDAHTDVRPLIDGKYPHSGSGFRQLLEDKTLKLEEFYEFGIQSFAASKQHIEYVQNRGKSVVFYDEIRQKVNFEQSFTNALDKCTKSSNNVYVSFDMDAVASAYAPGVSAPAAIGFTADEICRAAEIAGGNSSVKLIDIAEVNPTFDIDGRTSKLAALVVAHYIGGVLRQLSK
ncbi:MAG: formimidoylglutamase [Ignavibacteriae bacterium]|nr:formimidoylglutamase [Ignavibacteriota bacterium]